jgi:hypothetical protein
MYRYKKHFTLDEARACIPDLRSILKDAQSRRERLNKQEDKLGQQLLKAGGDLGGPPVTSMMMDLLQMNLQLQRIEKMGVVLKDLDRGLFDFPHLRDGREVFLCWELDEEDIEFWHDMESGYAGRERL